MCLNADAQVIYTETFTGADDQSSTTIDVDHTWSVMANVAELSGNAMIEGLESYVIMDLTTDLSVNHASDTVVFEGDFTVTTLSTGEVVAIGMTSITEFGGPRYAIAVNLTSSGAPLTVVVSDGITSPTVDFGTPGSLVAGTTYHVTAEFAPGATDTTCTVSMIATAGPGTDIVNGASSALPATLDSNTGPFHPTFVGADDAASFAFDNLVISASPTVATVPTANGIAITSLVAIVILSGIAKVARARRPIARGNPHN